MRKILQIQGDTVETGLVSELNILKTMWPRHVINPLKAKPKSPSQARAEAWARASLWRFRLLVATALLALPLLAGASSSVPPASPASAEALLRELQQIAVLAQSKAQSQIPRQPTDQSAWTAMQVSKHVIEKVTILNQAPKGAGQSEQQADWPDLLKSKSTLLKYLYPAASPTGTAAAAKSRARLN